jgi:hypothetical protein
MKKAKKAKMVSLLICVASLALVLSCASGAPAGGGSWEWRVDTDKGNGGTSTINMSDETMDGLPGHAFQGNITKKYEYGYVNVQLTPDDAMLDQLKKAKAISFRVVGNGEPLSVKITTSDVKDYAYFEYSFETVDGKPQTVIVPVEYFMQPSWGKVVGNTVNLANSQFIEYQFQGPAGPYAFKLWDFRVHTKGIPKESDVLPKGAPKPAAAKAGAAAPVEEKPIGGDLSPMEIRLADNFEYGDNYQAVIADKRLFNGHKIVPGEKYTLKITYTASRDLENVVEVGLVDTTPSANYWGALSFRNGADTGAPDGMAVLPKSKKDEKVTATIKLTTTAAATGTSGLANALVFGTKGAGRKGTKGSGVQKAVTLTCTEFVFTKD